MGSALQNIKISQMVYYNDLLRNLQDGRVISRALMRARSSVRASRCLAMTWSCLSPRHWAPRADNSEVMRPYK